MYFYFSNLSWWLIIALNFIGFFIFMFGMILGASYKINIGKEHPIFVLLEFFGGVVTSISFIIMFLSFGIVAGLIFILIFFPITTPVVAGLIELVKKILWPKI